MRGCSAHLPEIIGEYSFSDVFLYSFRVDWWFANDVETDVCSIEKRSHIWGTYLVDESSSRL